MKKSVDPRIGRLDSIPGSDYFDPYISNLYGADYLIARYLGLECPPSRVPGVWAHGWHPAHQNIEPAIVIGGRCSYNLSEKQTCLFWVARKDQEEYLRKSGYRKAKAIGLPVVYLPKRSYLRIKGSLLVMPAHTLDYTTAQWNFEEYADEIKRIESRFSKVVACVYPSCLEKGYWVDAFKRRGFTVIPGCAANDRNSLWRLQTLLSSFEYMTTNSFGSNLAYGAYFGGKVSIHGRYAEYQLSDYVNDPVFKSCPQLMSRLLATTTENAMREHYPFLFCEPDSAETNQAWGAHEVGESCRVAPDELRRLFRWDAWSLRKREIQARCSPAISLISRLTPRPIKDTVKSVVRYGA